MKRNRRGRRGREGRYLRIDFGWLVCACGRRDEGDFKTYGGELSPTAIPRPDQK